MSPEKRRAAAQRGYARTKAQGKIHVFTKEELADALKKRWGTLPPEHPYTYNKQERIKRERMEVLKKFFKERAKLFGRERNLMIGANRPYEKFPDDNEADEDQDSAQGNHNEEEVQQKGGGEEVNTTSRSQQD